MTSKEQRRRELARAKLARQQARRQQEERRRRRLAIIGAAVAVVVVIAGVTYLTVNQNGSSPAAAPGISATPTPTATATETPAPGECQYRPSGTASKPVDPPPDGPATVSGTLSATITTNLGPIAITLDADAAPCTVESFQTLAAAGFFNNTPCHRLTTSPTLKVLQCGDPTGTGTGGPGYAYNDEVTSDLTYKAGTLAMANGGPNTNGSQFFLVYGDSTLPPSYTVFGTVSQAGLDLLAQIAAAGVKDGGQDGTPASSVTITSVTVTAPTAPPTTSPAGTPGGSATPSGTAS